MKEQRIKKFFEEVIKHKIGSGLIGAWGKLDQVSSAKIVCEGRTFHQEFSSLGIQPKGVNETTFFDLASLTKTLFTTSLLMKWVDQGKINLDQKYKNISIREYLSHTSGYAAWEPIYESLKSKYGIALPQVSIQKRTEDFYAEVLKIAPLYPAGTQTVYSDINFWLLGMFVEELSQCSLEQLFKNEVHDFIPQSKLHFRPVLRSAWSERVGLEQCRDSYAATELCLWRGLLQAQVHDDNAWAKGGVSTHAGLFGSMLDCLGWINALVNERFASWKTMRQFFDEHISPQGFHSGRGLGFDRVDTRGMGSTAFAFSSQSVGHLGFSGTSLWMDLDSGDFAVLLSNRVHPQRTDLRIRKVRQIFHTLVRE